MQERRPLGNLRTFGQKCLSFCLTAVLLCFVALAANAAEGDEISDSPAPVIISTTDSTRALATYPGVWRGALPRRNAEVFQPGGRVVLFLTNIDLMPDESANAFRVFAEDAAGKQYSTLR